MRILTADIVSGVRPTGAMLPKETDLAAEFDVSRGVARETIRAMEERGLISVKHGKGATVNGAKHWDLFDPDVLAATLDSEAAGDVLAEYLECRRVLEVEAAGFAAERATKKDLEAMSQALARMEESSERPASQAAEELFHQADIAFHQALIGATGNRALGGLVERIHSALLIARYPLARPQYRQERALPEHRRILAAVSSGDPEEARQAMSDHLDTVARYLGEHRGTVRRKRRRPSASNRRAAPVP
jgi:GntR family transcriptional repressor for pyruvate dehydrogenase complex